MQDYTQNMMYWSFNLEKVPDLSLTKYMSLDEAGVDGVLEKHGSFLRQLNRKGNLSKVYFHLLYTYRPEKAKGEKLSISLIASGHEDALVHTKELIQNSSLSPFYNIISNEYCNVISRETETSNETKIVLRNHLGYVKTYAFDGSIKCTGEYFRGKRREDYFRDAASHEIGYSVRIIGNRILEISSESTVGANGLLKCDKEYQYRSTLSKREFFVQPSVILPDDNDLKYYKIAEWKMNDDARLYNMLRLMQGLDTPVTFMRLRDVLPIKELRNRTSMKATRSSSSISVNRDENAEETLKQYNAMIENYECSPHFRMNIVSFADDVDVSELIVDAAGAEAVESGSYTIRSISHEENGDKFTVYSNMERPIDVALPEVINYLRFMPTLFLLEEAQHLFVLPALFDGESIEIPKETAPTYDSNGMKIAVDENGYDVIFPISLLKKHAFLAGVPGSGKTFPARH